MSLMGTEESNRSAMPYKILVAHNETINKTLPPHWSTSQQAYLNPGSTPTSFLNSYAASSNYYQYMWANQAYNMPLQYDSLHDSSRLSSPPIVAAGVALNSSETVQRIFSEENLDSMKNCDRTARGSKESSDEGRDTKTDFPSTKKQQCDIMLANGEDAQKVARIGNCNPVHVNKNSVMQDFAVNSTELNPNLGTGLNEFQANSQLVKLDEDEIRKARKRQLNRESARRSRICKRQEYEELQKTLNDLMGENSSLKHELMSLSEECLEVNDENNSIEEELLKKYGPESISDLVAMKPAS